MHTSSPKNSQQLFDGEHGDYPIPMGLLGQKHESTKQHLIGYKKISHLTESNINEQEFLSKAMALFSRMENENNILDIEPLKMIEEEAEPLPESMGLFAHLPVDYDLTADSYIDEGNFINQSFFFCTSYKQRKFKLL